MLERRGGFLPRGPGVSFGFVRHVHGHARFLLIFRCERRIDPTAIDSEARDKQLIPRPPGFIAISGDNDPFLFRATAHRIAVFRENLNQRGPHLLF